MVELATSGSGFLTETKNRTSASTRAGPAAGWLGLHFFLSYLSHFYFHAVVSGLLFLAVIAHHSEGWGTSFVSCFIGACVLFAFDLVPATWKQKLGARHVWWLIGPHALVIVACGVALGTGPTSFVQVCLVGLMLALVSPAHAVGIAILRDNSHDLPARIATHSIFGLLGSVLVVFVVPFTLMPTGNFFALVLAALIVLTAMALCAASEARWELTPGSRNSSATKSPHPTTPSRGAAAGAAILILLSDITYYASHGILAHDAPASAVALLFAVPLAGVVLSHRLPPAIGRAWAGLLLAAGAVSLAATVLSGCTDFATFALGLPMFARVFVLDHANLVLAEAKDRPGAAFTAIAPVGAGVGAALAILGAGIPTAGILACVGLLSALQFAAFTAWIKGLSVMPVR